MKRFLVSRRPWCAVVFLFVAGCARQVLVPLDAEDEFARGMTWYDQHSYPAAIQSFEWVIFYHAASQFVDDAQFHLALCYYEQRDYDQAVVEFEYLIRNLPNTPFLERAYLYRAKAYYAKAPGYDRDQSQTREAINLLDEFINSFPNSEHLDEARTMILEARTRLARKECENGKLYLKLKEPASAAIYFRYVIENYPETSVVPDATYHLGLALEAQGLVEQAAEQYRTLFEDPDWQVRARARLEKLAPKGQD